MLIGPYLFRKVLSPDLKIGTIFAVFRLPATIPVLNDERDMSLFFYCTAKGYHNKVCRVMSITIGVKCTARQGYQITQRFTLSLMDITLQTLL